MKNEPKPAPAAVTPTKPTSVHVRHAPSPACAAVAGGVSLGKLGEGALGGVDETGALDEPGALGGASGTPSSMRSVAELWAGSRCACSVRDARPGMLTLTL